MTEPLPITEPCGCEVGQGHVCPPPWVDAEEWAAVIAYERARGET